MGDGPVTLDFSKAQPVSASPVTLDFSKAQPVEAPGTTGVSGVLSGIGGGVIGTAAGAAGLLNKALPSSMQIPKIPEQYYKQSTTSEQIGGGLETIGEFLVGDEALKGLSLADRFGLSQKVAQLAQQSPRLAKAIEFGMNAVRSGTVTGTQGAVGAAAAGQPIAPAAAEGFAGGTLGSLGGEAFGGVTKALGERLEQGAPRIGNALLQANKVKNFLYGKNPGRVFMDEDIPLKGFTSYKDIAGALEDANTRIAGEARAVISQSPGANRALPVVPSVDHIFDQAEQAVQHSSGWNDRKGLLADLRDLQNEATGTFDKDGNYIGPKGPMTPAEITKLKTDIGRGTKWNIAKDEKQQTFVNNVRKQLYSYLDSSVDAAVPGMDKINERWANLIEAEGLIKKRVAQDEAAGFGQSALRSKAIIAAGLGIMKAGFSPEGALMILNEAARTPTGRMLRMKAGPPVGRALQAGAASIGQAARAGGAEAGASAAEQTEE
jgi:hypothetical protein